LGLDVLVRAARENPHPESLASGAIGDIEINIHDAQDIDNYGPVCEELRAVCEQILDRPADAGDPSRLASGPTSQVPEAHPTTRHRAHDASDELARAFSNLWHDTKDLLYNTEHLADVPGKISRALMGDEESFWDANFFAPSLTGVSAMSAVPKTIAGELSQVPRFAWDNRSFDKIRRLYWRFHGPADGRSLHHWLFPRRWTWVPQGLRNAGFNLLELPAGPRGLMHNLGLNQWMGWAPRWGGHERWLALGVENAIRVGIPGAIAGAIYAGAQIGKNAHAKEDPYAKK
jgi:hypothetical protein